MTKQSKRVTEQTLSVDSKLSINQSTLVYYGTAERRPTICTNKNTI